MKPSTLVFSAIKAIVILVASCLAFSQLSCTKEGPAGPQGTPGSNGTPDDLTNPNIIPSAIFTSPGNNTTGPFNLYTPAEVASKPHFVVRFNKYMLKSSVSPRSIRCEGFDRTVVVRLFTSYRGIVPLRLLGVNSEFYDNILEFTIEDSSSYYSSGRMPYRVGRTYTVVIDTLMEDINGNHPVSQYRFSFTPEPYFRVVDISPKSGATDVRQSLNAGISFNTLVDGSILQSVQFSSSIIGQWSIPTYDSARASFVSGVPLAFNTQCILTVLPTARDRYGNQIRTGYTSTFSITPFKVESWWPVGIDNPRTISPFADIYVYFTGFLDENTISQGWSITPPVVGSLNPYYSRDAIWFRPTIGFVPSTTYTVNLSTAIRALDGTTLQAPFAFSFVTDSFRCAYSSPSYGSTNVSPTTLMYFSFNSGIDTSTIRSSFAISPQTGVQYVVYGDRAESMSLTPANPLTANRTYTVTISTGLRSKTGASLNAPRTLVFTTGQ